MDSGAVDADFTDIEAVKGKVRLLRAKGQFDEGLEFVTALPAAIRKIKAVAIEVAQLYLVQGHYIRAAEACAIAAGPLFPEDLKDSNVPEEIFDEDSVCLELLRAYVDISRHCKLKAAVSIATRVHDAWFVPRDLPLPPSRQKESNALAQYHDLLGGSGDLVADAHDRPIRQSRILMEFYYHKIMVVAGEQGLLDEVAVKTAAIKRLEVLQAFTESRGRLREARFLVYFRISLLGKDPQVEHILKKFLDTLHGTDLEIEKAFTRMDLAEWQLQSGDPEITALSELHFREAQEVFKRIGHKNGCLDIEHLRISYTRELTKGEAFLRKQELADRYFAVNFYQNGIRCLAFSIPSALEIGGYHEQIQRSIQILQEKVDEVGGELLKQMVFINSVSGAALQAPEYGYALRSLEGYLAHPPPEIPPKNHGFLTSCLHLIYTSLGNFTEALGYAEKAFSIFSEGTSYNDKSDYAFQLAWARDLYRSLYTPGTSEDLLWLKSSIALLEEWVDSDRECGYSEGEYSKCLQLAALEDYRAQFHKDNNAAYRAEQWHRRACTITPGDGPHTLPNSIAEIQVRIKMREQKFDEAIAIATAALETCRKNPAAPIIHTAQSAVRIATALQMRVHSRHQDGVLKSGEGAAQDLEQLISAAGMAFQALEVYRRAGDGDVIVTCANYTWSIIQDIVILNNKLGGQLLRAFIGELEKTEAVCDSTRRSIAPSENIQSLMEKRRLVSHKGHLELYSAGVRTCLQLGDRQSAWLWIQKGKARSLSDAFGFRALVPDHILNAIKEDKAAFSLYEREKQSSLNALHASPEGYIGAARKAEIDRAEMMKIPILAQVVALREGAFDIGLEGSALDSSLQASNISKDQVKYIDWFILRTKSGQGEHIILFVRQLDNTTYMRILSITIQTVENWIRKCHFFPEGADPPLSKKTGNRLLAEMDGLVDGLEEFTQPDDLLILSPSGLLNSIPLHGLRVEGRALIDRNLVVYSSSAAVFRHCLIRTSSRLTQAAQAPQARKTTFLAVYEELTPAAQKERPKIFEHADFLASQFPGTVVKGSKVTKDEFRSQSQEAGWIHYHGHAIYAKDDVLKSALILSDGTDISSSSEPESLAPGAGRSDLTVPEFFEMPMMDNAPHFTIIACDSGTQDIAAGDEPLGLIPALLYAGATSVLGCLWPIESSVGRVFSEKFYRHLKNAAVDADAPQPVLNLAKALREAVREMMAKSSTDTRQPHCWAPFALHGSWIYVS